MPLEKYGPQGQEQRILVERSNAAKSGWNKGQNSPDPGGSPPIVYPARTDKRLELLGLKRDIKRSCVFALLWVYCLFKVQERLAGGGISRMVGILRILGQLGRCLSYPSTVGSLSLLMRILLLRLLTRRP